MYVKNWLGENISLDVTEESSSTIISTTTTDLDITTIITSTASVPPISSSLPTTTTTSTTVTTPGGEEDDEKKWVLPLIIGLGCAALIVGVAAIVIIYRKWKCFGLPLPFLRRNVKLAQPIKKIADSVRSSISSTFSSGGSLPGREKSDKQFRKYAVKLSERKVDGGDASLDWIEGKDFSAEFEAMKRADLKDIPVMAAMKQENVMRNRFSNVLPYDRNRVILTAEGASGNDYVNASYVSGHRKQQEFICTQGPLKHTVVDFWRMCWETRAEAIVMLTKCYEKNQEKCHPYWPSGNTGNSTFGDIKVTLERKRTWKQSGQGSGQDSGDHLWLVSELVMEKEGEADTRPIIHVVFLSWPDFGVVDPPSSLISFVKHVRGLVKGDSHSETNNNGKYKGDKGNGPVVVHCSAGVGRSGVLIAVHQLIEQLEEIGKEEERNNDPQRNKSVNIFQIVAKMRRERMGMVQNLQQYSLIYKCLRVLVSMKGGSKKEIEEPSMVSNEVIQGSDWGLLYPEGS